MTPNLGGWIHSFTVTDTQTHKGGYTIYKITSIVFPYSIPEALTRLTVWRRFHDVKRLHRELQRRYKALKLPGKLPEPTDSTYFKRFDENVIQRRKQYILELLDFAALHPVLYKCYAFTQFFCDPQALSTPPLPSPLHQLHVQQDGQVQHDSVIAKLCDKLDVRYDPHNADLAPTKAEQTEVPAPTQTENKENMPKVEKQKDYMRYLTPMASIESEDSDYIYEAALEFSQAVQAEANVDYKEAHACYKRGVELLLHGSKDDTNDERKYIAKTKISKYLARADDIFEKFLSQPAADALSSCNVQLSLDLSDNAAAGQSLYLERPWNHLAKYKVLQIFGQRVMQVQCITEPQRPTYVIKGIEKPAMAQTIFLPQQVPYMVDLLAYFQSEHKLFLLLKQAEGGRLFDYMQCYTPTAQHAAPGNLELLFADETVCNQQQLVMPTSSTEFSELVRCSQQLLESVSNTLKVVKQLDAVEDTATVEYVKTQSNAKLNRIPEASLKQWARELLVAIHSLHAKGVILGDLHMDNLLLGAKGQLLLSYFYQNESLSASVDEHQQVLKAYSTEALLGHFVAPERPLTIKSDWWSYGVVLYQLLLGMPFKTTHPGYIELYSSVQFPEPLDLSDDARDLLENLIQQIPEERFSYEQIKEHRFFNGTDWAELLRMGTAVTNAKASN